VEMGHWTEIGGGFVAALLVGTLAEYVMHRLMHAGKVLHKVHAKHHQTAQGQGWLGEFRDYFLPSIPILPAGFLYSVDAGIGFVIGGTIYAMWAAYAHQVQHEKPELVFWLRQPVHHLHHHHKMWHHNFGISVSIWDHVFRTYKKCEWAPAKRPLQHPLSSYFRIKWY
jgi:sterol desaturase/sphingolipid hydroxylase (fatty acid hydroxylase superfamily)